jgi:hypothetical protein
LSFCIFLRKVEGKVSGFLVTIAAFHHLLVIFNRGCSSSALTQKQLIKYQIYKAKKE